jgi:transcriptional regulator with XRE-family HTH domain
MGKKTKNTVCSDTYTHPVASDIGSEKGSELGDFSANQESFGSRISEARKSFGFTQKELAQKIGVTANSIQNYEKGQVPSGDIVVRLARVFNCSTDWLLTGEDEPPRSGTRFANVTQTRELTEGRAPETKRIQWSDAAPTEPVAPHPSIYNDTSQQSGIADLVAKTIEVLQSNTVFETALKSNIEAFHRAIVLEKQIDQVEDRIMAKIGGRLDALESSNQQLQTENAQLHAENRAIRHDLEESRAASAIRDTG